MQQILGQTDGYSPMKKSNSVTHNRTFLLAMAVIKNKLLTVLWNETGAQISAKTQ